MAQASAKEKRNKPKLDCLKTGHFQNIIILQAWFMHAHVRREFPVRKFEE